MHMVLDVSLPPNCDNSFLPSVRCVFGHARCARGAEPGTRCRKGYPKCQNGRGPISFDGAARDCRTYRGSHHVFYSVGHLHESCSGAPTILRTLLQGGHVRLSSDVDPWRSLRRSILPSTPKLNRLAAARSAGIQSDRKDQ
jgi:hypothetical protein